MMRASIPYRIRFTVAGVLKPATTGSRQFLIGYGSHGEKELRGVSPEEAVEKGLTRQFLIGYGSLWSMASPDMRTSTGTAVRQFLIGYGSP